MTVDFDKIDAVYLLKDMAQRNATERWQNAITINLVWRIETASGPIRVDREVILTPEEVLGVLSARQPWVEPEK